MSGKSGSGSSSDTSTTLVILDSLNYIKGFRYELYCISKAAGERHGVIWIMGSGEDERGLMEEKEISESDALAKKRNLERKEKVLALKQQQQTQDCVGTGDERNSSGYDDSIELDGYFENDETIDALILRYEPPDEKNRWENPLYKVNLTKVHPWGRDGTLESASKSPTEDKLASKMKSVKVDSDSAEEPETMEPVKVAPKKSASGFKRSKKSLQQRSARQTQSMQFTSTGELSANDIANGASATAKPAGEKDEKQKMEDVINKILNSFLLDIKPLKEGLSTQSMVSAESNVLNQADNITQRINNEIIKAQKLVSLATGVGGKILIPLDGNNGKRRAMELSQPLHVNELRNFRRQFLKWIGGHPVRDGTKEEDFAETYVSYIETHI